MKDEESYVKFLLALCLWREARGEGIEGMQAVAAVVCNRVRLASKSDQLPADLIVRAMVKPHQFSAMTFLGDPQTIAFPLLDDAQFEQALAISGDALTGKLLDPTNGSTHYFNPRVVRPTWASSLVKVITIGKHDFYKSADTPLRQAEQQAEQKHAEDEKANA